MQIELSVISGLGVCLCDLVTIPSAPAALPTESCQADEGVPSRNTTAAAAAPSVRSFWLKSVDPLAPTIGIVDGWQESIPAIVPRRLFVCLVYFPSL